MSNREKACSESGRFSATLLNENVEATETSELFVAGVDCGEEVALIESALKKTGSVRDVRVQIMSGKTVIGHNREIDEEGLIEAIGRAGLGASRRHDRPVVQEPMPRGPLVAVCLSGALTVIALALGFVAGLNPVVRTACLVAAILLGGRYIVSKAVRALRQRRLDMNVLMTIAVLGAAGIGEWTEAAVVVVLFALSELLESYSVARARRAVESLLELSPDTAWVERDRTFVERPVSEVAVGETVRVRPGARVPLDGKVIDGASSVNQAPITGESLPVEKRSGDGIYAGTINGEGSLTVRVTESAGDTTLARIVRLVEEAQEQKAPAQRFVDRFARIYTPIVMILALAVFLIPGLLGGNWTTWFYRALVILVIACPCALVISTPVSVVSGLTALARRGVLVKGGAWLEALGRLRAIAVDKTGTITRGEPQVRKVIALPGHGEKELLRIAASLDSHSNHPIARAVVDHAREKRIELSEVTDYRAVPGRGAEGTVDGHQCFVGNHRFAHESGVCSEEVEKRLAEVERLGLSVVLVGHRTHDACEGRILGLLAVGDTIREEAKRAVKSLRMSGINPVVMLSGDHATTVAAVAESVGIDEAHGDLLPEDKIDRVRALRERYGELGMIGDGVNDAPAMAAASVGIAMGAAGTDTAIETADVALMTDDLEKVGEAIRLGRRTLSIIRFNIAFSILIKVVFLLLATFGYAGLWLAILADTGATFLVVANALRLLRR